MLMQSVFIDVAESQCKHQRNYLLNVNIELQRTFIDLCLSYMLDIRIPDERTETSFKLGDFRWIHESKHTKVYPNIDVLKAV